MSDIEGLNELVRDLTEAPGKVQRRAPLVITEGARMVQTKWRQEAGFSRHAPYYPASITFELRWKGSALEAEIGPDKALPQGALGNLIEYGSANNPPHGNDVASLAEAAPKVEKALEGLVDL